MSHSIDRFREIVRNERQRKSFDVYHAHLRNAFNRMYSVLKPGGYLTLTFHNPTFKVRNATIYAGVMAGFNLEKIHHQPLGQVSAKAMLQPFGSAQGDFYLRFYKAQAPSSVVRPEEIDEARFERIVVETAKRVLAERGEPTPYTILMNAIDPELARNGYFSELLTGLDVRSVLEKHKLPRQASGRLSKPTQDRSVTTNGCSSRNTTRTRFAGCTLQ